MPKTLLLAGGGHAHMQTLARLNRFIGRGHRVVVVQPSPCHYYSGMGPGMLSGMYAPEEIRFATRHVVEKQGGTFLLDRVTGVDPEKSFVHLASGQQISYDVVSFNTGSSVPENIVSGIKGDGVFMVKPIERLQKARKAILDLASKRPIKVAVIGGGPSAVEIAGNVWGLVHGKYGGGHLSPVQIRIFARTTIMTSFPDGVRYKAIDSLKSRGIEILEHSAVEAVRDGKVVLDSGQESPFDVLFLAVGVRPSAFFKECGLKTGPDGGLAVNRFLQSVEYENIFGGGDCIHFEEQPLDKVGVYAVRENPVLLHNLMAALEGGTFKEFDPGGDYLLIFNLGDGTGILRKKCILFGGRPAFLIKDYIDRKFMRKFQACE